MIAPAVGVVKPVAPALVRAAGHQSCQGTRRRVKGRVSPAALIALRASSRTAASVDAVKALGSPLAGRLVDQVAARSAACREQLLQ